MSGEHGGTADDPNNTIHGAPRSQPDALTSETIHDCDDGSETDVAQIDAPATAQSSFIQKFKRRLNGEGHKPASP